MYSNLKSRHPYIVQNDNVVKGFFGPYRFLSNFHSAPVVFEGIRYPSSENAYQAAKSLDPDVRKMFVDYIDPLTEKKVDVTPSQSKKMGREINCRSDWDQVKYKIMFEIVMDKFNRNPELAEMLMETGDRYLEETNNWGDTCWGVCNGVGTNWLGKILMDVRNQLK